MSLSSESIQKKEFHIVFKGYKPEEVDKFLDMLALEFDGLQKKISDMEEKMDSLKYEGDGESSKMKKVIQEALVSAHRMAEEIKQKAKIEAEEIIGRRKMEEEQELRRLQEEKTSLESDISRLRSEYTGFKEQVSRFADEFKKKMASAVDNKLMDAVNISGSDSRQEKASGQAQVKSQDTEEEAKPDPSSVEENRYRHASRESRDDNIGENDLKDLAALTDEMLEKLEDKEEQPKDNATEDGGDKEDTGPETKNDSEDTKRNRKKIDIANPDIINDFFKTDED